MKAAALGLTLALMAVLFPSLAAADGELVPRTDELFISAGCPQDTPGTCTSTRWLGKGMGDANSNWLTSTTPVDEVLYRLDGSINWRDYASDDTFPTDGYVLDADRDLQVNLRVVNNVLMVNETAHARITLLTASGAENLPAQSQEVLVVNPLGSHTFTFDFDIPESLHEVTVAGMTVEVAVHGVNARGGYIDQSGGSNVVIPHLVVEE